MENACAKKKRFDLVFRKPEVREILETSSRRERNHALTFRSCHPISSPKSHIRPRMKLIYALLLLSSSERSCTRGVHKSVDYSAVFESLLEKKGKKEEKEKKERRTVNPFKEKKGKKAAPRERVMKAYSSCVDKIFAHNSPAMNEYIMEKILIK